MIHFNTLVLEIPVLPVHFLTKSTKASRISWGTQQPFRVPQFLFLTGYAPPAILIILHSFLSISIPAAQSAFALRSCRILSLLSAQKRSLHSQKTVFASYKIEKAAISVIHILTIRILRLPSGALRLPLFLLLDSYFSFFHWYLLVCT